MALYMPTTFTLLIDFKGALALYPEKWPTYFGVRGCAIEYAVRAGYDPIKEQVKPKRWNSVSALFFSMTGSKR